MRGAPPAATTAPSTGRIIPADAGSTEEAAHRILTRRDHPRGCGEHRLLRLTVRHGRGSSPRMRGAQPPATGCPAGFWIIPADAGSTCLLLWEWPRTRDHPRGCGEHNGRVINPACLSGSSPRMRGALGRPYACAGMWRIIPADAGSTRANHKPRSDRQDHPRGCGEHGHRPTLL